LRGLAPEIPLNRRLFAASALAATFAALLAVPVLPVHAAEFKPYDNAAFNALQAAGKPVVIHVHADWCPTCKLQALILTDLFKSPSFRDYTVLRVDFDTQQDVRKALRVGAQSTLIVYRGRNEVARSVGDTSKDSINAALRKAAS
jgi:thiol:disulfide interchange protein